MASFAVAQEPAAAAKPVAAPPKYEVVEPNAAYFEPGNVKRMNDAIAQLGRGVADIDGRIAAAYFTQYIPGLVTNPQKSIEANEAIEMLRKTMQRAEMRGDQAPIDTLNNYLFRSMGQIANGNYYPPARVMAISVIGELNSKPISLQNQTAPEPYSAAIGPLFGWARAEDELDGVRAAAMVGLQRHLSLKPISGNAAKAIADSMRKLLDTPKPPQRDAAAHAYLQRFAVDIFNAVTGGSDKAFGSRLVSIAADREQPNLIALHSAATIGKLKAPVIAEANELSDPQPMLDAWSHRLLDTLEQELDRLKALKPRRIAMNQPRAPETYLEKRVEATEAERPRVPSGMGGMAGGMMEMDMGMEMEMEMDDYIPGDDMGAMGGMGGMGRMMGGMNGMMGMMGEAKPQPPEVIAARKAINYTIESLHAAAAGNPVVGEMADDRGIAAALPEEKRGPISTWTAELTELATQLNDPLLDDLLKFQLKLEEIVPELQAKLNVLPVNEAGNMAAPMDPLMGPGDLGGPQPNAAAPDDLAPGGLAPGGLAPGDAAPADALDAAPPAADGNLDAGLGGDLGGL